MTHPPTGGGGIKDGSNFLGYEILRSLSKSTGEAEIYLVQKSGKKFVLKHYYPNFSPKYEILEKLKGINHPDIINLYEYGNQDGRFYEIMDFAEGGTLADKTPEGRYKYLPMKEEDVLQVVKETVNAYDFCHSKGIVHRDIKPGNLFYKNADGSDILVGDFGISSEVDLEGGMSKRMTTTSRTEGYAAPEIYSGVIGKEIDYYALGITVYELLTGKNPFAGRNDMHIMRDTIQGRVAEDLITRPEANSFSNRIKKLIQGLLTVKHEKRWGHLEVSRFLKGEDVPVAENLIKEIPAFTFNSKKYTDYVELSLALQEDRESAKKMLYRGNLTRWAEGFDNDFALMVGDIVEKFGKLEEQDFGLIQLLFLLNPERSCRLENGRTLKTIEEFRKLVFENAESLTRDLQNEFSELHAWAIQNGLKEFNNLIIQQNKLNLSQKKYISNLQVAFTEGFQPKNEKISVYVISDILNLEDSDKQKIFNWALDRDSYFSAWFEIKGNKKKYDIWWSGKVQQTKDSFINLLEGKIIEFGSKFIPITDVEEKLRLIQKYELNSPNPPSFMFLMSTWVVLLLLGFLYMLLFAKTAAEADSMIVKVMLYPSIVTFILMFYQIFRFKSYSDSYMNIKKEKEIPEGIMNYTGSIGENTVILQKKIFNENVGKKHYLKTDFFVVNSLNDLRNIVDILRKISEGDQVIISNASDLDSIILKVKYENNDTIVEIKKSN